EVDAAPGERCDRCWMHTPDVGADARYPGACARCVVHLDAGRAAGAWPDDGGPGA
ncbi:MAG: zinc finger domain-containing protein, partial [Acidobacteriota bacterium]